MNVDAVLINLGLAIRARREAIGISQEEFADRIDSNRAYYGDVERGKRNPSIRSLHRIADGLGVSLPQLFAEAAAHETARSAATTASRRSARPRTGHRGG